MKTIVEPWRELFSEIDDVISHSLGEGLPLKSIELSPPEWDLFIWAHEHFKVARSNFRGTQKSMRKHKETRYQGVKIYREKG